MSTPRSDRPLLCLAGPTGVGKTAIAVELCRRFGGEIVGADSVQIYRELDIGSGKPTAAELRGVRHHLIDRLAPTESIDAAAYAALADQAIAQVQGRGALAVVAGGTGLWLRALLRGLVALPHVDRELRSELERQYDELGAEPMHRRLRAVDPQTAARVHAGDRVRVIRALEVHAQTGRPLGELQAAHALGQPRYRALTLVLDVPLPHWRLAVEARIRAMLASGWADEVRRLCERYGPDIKPLRSVGYRQLVLGLRDGLPEAEIERRIVRATRLYAKRQRNWFRGEPSVDCRMRADEVLQPPMLARIEEHLRASTSR